MFRIPPVTKYLLLTNVVIFLCAYLFGSLDYINNLFGLHFFLAPDFHWYQLVTYMFMHGGWAHIFFNMFALWMFGGIIEKTLQPRRFLYFYLVCGIGAGIFQEAAQFVEFLMMCNDQIPQFSLTDISVVAHNSSMVLNLWTTVGASGAIYGILLAFGMCYPNQRIFIFPLPIPIKAKWFVIIYAAIELFSALGVSRDGVAHVAHLGGMVFAYFFIRQWLRQERRIDSDPLFRRTASWNVHRRRPEPEAAAPEERREDWDYNAAQRKKQEEIDAILDKIRKSGYDSLTTEEKQTLFDNSR